MDGIVSCCWWHGFEVVAVFCCWELSFKKTNVSPFSFFLNEEFPVVFGGPSYCFDTLCQFRRASWFHPAARQLSPSQFIVAVHADSGQAGGRLQVPSQPEGSLLSDEAGTALLTPTLTPWETSWPIRHRRLQSAPARSGLDPRRGVRHYTENQWCQQNVPPNITKSDDLIWFAKVSDWQQDIFPPIMGFLMPFSPIPSVGCSGWIDL